MLFKVCFNSTLVQLKEISRVRIKLHLLRFNSTLVQLKVNILSFSLIS